MKFKRRPQRKKCSKRKILDGKIFLNLPDRKQEEAFKKAINDIFSGKKFDIYKSIHDKSLASKSLFKKVNTNTEYEILRKLKLDLFFDHIGISKTKFLEDKFLKFLSYNNSDDNKFTKDNKLNKLIESQIEDCAYYKCYDLDRKIIIDGLDSIRNNDIDINKIYNQKDISHAMLCLTAFTDCLDNLDYVCYKYEDISGIAEFYLF